MYKKVRMISVFYFNTTLRLWSHVHCRKSLTCLGVDVVVRVVCVCVCGMGGGVRQYTTSREPPCGIIDHFVSHICHIKVVNWLFKALHIPFIHNVRATCMHWWSSRTLPRAVMNDVPILSAQRFSDSTNNERHLTKRWIHLGMCVVWIMVRFHIKVRARAYT